MSKSWPNDPGVGSFPINLVELIETDVELEEELNEFEGTFDRNEIVNMSTILFISYCSILFFHFDIYCLFYIQS